MYPRSRTRKNKRMIPNYIFIIIEYQKQVDILFNDNYVNKFKFEMRT